MSIELEVIVNFIRNNKDEMMEEYENAILAAEAEKRLSKKVKYTSHEDIMKKFGLTEVDLDDVEVNLE